MTNPLKSKQKLCTLVQTLLLNPSGYARAYFPMQQKTSHHYNFYNLVTDFYLFTHISNYPTLMLSRERPPRPIKFGINPCMHAIRKIHDSRSAVDRNKLSLDRTSWQYVTYAFDMGTFHQHAQIVVAGRNYLAWKVIRHSLELGNDIKHYFTISQIPRDSLKGSILAGFSSRLRMNSWIGLFLTMFQS